jgi:DNA-binding GntR family transcriptional regulator
MPTDRSQFPFATAPDANAAHSSAVAPIVRAGLVRERIHGRLRESIVSRALPPGTKLTEEVIGGAFNASRSAVRWALARLQDEGLVELYPNRGAYVAQPVLAEARNIFAARRLIEVGIVRVLAARSPAQDLTALETCIADEHAAHRAGDLKTALRLSGEFHIILAEHVGNPVITDMLRGLVSRTVLALAVNQHRDNPGCRTHEHSAFLDLLRQGDVEGATQEMEQHLLSLERELDTTTTTDTIVDLRSVLLKDG